MTGSDLRDMRIKQACVCSEPRKYFGYKVVGYGMAYQSWIDFEGKKIVSRIPVKCDQYVDFSTDILFCPYCGRSLIEEKMQ